MPKVLRWLENNSLEDEADGQSAGMSLSRTLAALSAGLPAKDKEALADALFARRRANWCGRDGTRLKPVRFYQLIFALSPTPRTAARLQEYFKDLFAGAPSRAWGAETIPYILWLMSLNPSAEHAQWLRKYILDNQNLPAAVPVMLRMKDMPWEERFRIFSQSLGRITVDSLNKRVDEILPALAEFYAEGGDRE